MDNYKIKVNDEAESKEAQELFLELGYEKGSVAKKYPSWISNFEYSGNKEEKYTSEPSECWVARCKELTLPQLRDLVVLKRNDVKDATHQDKYDASLKYVYLNGKWYEWLNCWMAGCINPAKLTPIAQPQDPTLITGAEALRALADGKDVEGFSEENEEWIPIVYFTMQEVVNGLYKFRLKPQTIKLELEMPKPFEPEEDCHVYILDDGKTDGYRRYSYEVHGDKGNTFIGIWRTEEEIKQVVEQLRKIRGTNS
ncbi:hypothetical protein QZJ90_09285 [Acinetobacter baumannii]|nr:hypothetical protein [Acinetobacter baumannii]